MADIFTATQDATTGSVRIVASIAGADSLIVQRQVSGGEWESVRSMNPWAQGSAAGVRDMECPFDVPVMYRVHGFANGVQVGQTMTAGPVTVSSVTGDWLRPITRPLAGMRVWVESYPSLAREGRVGTFDVLGSAERVALTAKRGLPKGQLTLITMTDTERVRMNALLATGEPLCFLTPAAHGIGRQYLVVFGSSEERVTNYALEQARRWVLTVEEIGYPAGQTAEWEFQTWAGVKDTGVSWGDLPKQYAMWLSIPETAPALPPSPGGGQRSGQIPSPARFGV